MDRAELFEFLEMDTAEDFGYFEQFADLMECSDEIEFDDFYSAISKAEADILAEINENYFTELEKSFPEDCDDFLEILMQAHTSLKQLADNISEDSYRREYAEQLFNFHEMFVKEDGAMVDRKPCSVLDAITENRAAKLQNEKHTYNFENSLDYTPDYISMRLGDFEEDE